MHRKMMEKYLGRKLKPNEIVHHKDGDSCNNNIDNLEVLSRKDHYRLHYTKREDYSKQNLEEIKQLLKQEQEKDRREAIRALNILFSPNQHRIIIKKIYGKKLSKTEREVYSRDIKKKLLTLLNPKIADIAWSIIVH